MRLRLQMQTLDVTQARATTDKAREVCGTPRRGNSITSATITIKLIPISQVQVSKVWYLAGSREHKLPHTLRATKTQQKLHQIAAGCECQISRASWDPVSKEGQIELGQMLQLGYAG
jgi:hypothetical protein